ncbi:MAG: carboxypeptidase-like regulatory domain-containing protein [Bacteroidales bacterium]|nr:carboxypeptidase-like regulatory domain-containing protein [Bacteroidales bacterium]
MYCRLLMAILLPLFVGNEVFAQFFNLEGEVRSVSDNSSLAFATVVVGDNMLWAITNEDGKFIIKNVPDEELIVTVICLGYEKKEFKINRRSVPLIVLLNEESLKLNEVTITAKKNSEETASAYTIDRKTLEHSQILNAGDIGALLPGGKTHNSSLTSDSRILLRAGTAEGGNSSFGTAIEIDGVRVSNNAVLDETAGAAIRNISTSNIESVEVITGIPSVEYGDLSNGVVKINTKKGKSPIEISMSTNPYTKQISVDKGFTVGHRSGVFNVSVEHAKSFTNLVSPYTAYNRNNFDIRYFNSFAKSGAPLLLNASVSANVGGYNSENDPDAFSTDYTKVNDKFVRAFFKIDYLANKPWLTNIDLSMAASLSDKTTETNVNKNAPSSQANIHTVDEGYYMAADYNQDPNAQIIMGPVGYWSVLSFNNSEPVSFDVKTKAVLNKKIFVADNRISVGAQYSTTGNNGRGTYYNDIMTAPSWREYRYDRLPLMHNLSVYAEDRISHSGHNGSKVELTLGVRNDYTIISQSEYGTVSSFSPRANLKYTFWNVADRTFSMLNIYVGRGRSVKLPSFEVLYPSPDYYDVLVFAPGVLSDGKSYSTYYSRPFKALYNSNLKWQYSVQNEIGIQAEILKTKINISAYYNVVEHPYASEYLYTPFTYRATSIADVEQSGIDPENRIYSVDHETGIITVADRSGVSEPQTLNYTEKKALNTNIAYTNAAKTVRYGVEWIVDFAKIKTAFTQIRVDGNYYHYKGLNTNIIKYSPTSTHMSDGSPYRYIGWYEGSSNYSTSYGSSASAANGSINAAVNQNITTTTHIPKIRMIVSIRFESSLYNYRRSISQHSENIAFASDEPDLFGGVPYTSDMRDNYVVVYPKYYSTWENPNEPLPFYPAFAAAKDNDTQLYNDLAKLVAKSNYRYTFNPDNISFYCSANISVTKEIGNRASVTFYANNFFVNNGRVKSSQSGLYSSLYESAYIPRFYYGMSLKLKLL